MPIKFPGKETYKKESWWMAEGDDGETNVYKWDYRFNQCPSIRQAGMTGWAIQAQAPNQSIRLHMCAVEVNCPSRHEGSKLGMRCSCIHVRFRGFVPEDWMPSEDLPTIHAVFLVVKLHMLRQTWTPR